MKTPILAVLVLLALVPAHVQSGTDGDVRREQGILDLVDEELRLLTGERPPH
ncbi:MAG: hypothetical protein AAF501_21030 [Pseudomonadota bacterium]